MTLLGTLKLIVNNINNQKKEIYLINDLIYPFGDTKYIKIYSPSIYIKRIEDKLSIEIKLNIIKNGKFPDGFLIMDVELPTQKITNVLLRADINNEEDKVNIPESKHLPYIYKGSFTIDLNSDQYFDREITQEMVTMKLTFRDDNRYWSDIIINDERDVIYFKNELYEQEVITSFLYWNTIVYNGEKLTIPKEEKFRDNKLIWSHYYYLDISFNNFYSSIISYLLKINKSESDNYFLYSRGYKLKFSDIRTGKEILSIKSNLNKKLEDYYNFDSNYDFNIENYSFIETSLINGINMFNHDSYNLSGCVLLKLNNTNFRVKINENFYRTNYDEFDIKTKNISSTKEQGMSFNEI